MIPEACRLCGDDSPGARDAIAQFCTFVAGVFVCDPCAEAIGNAYMRARTGAWLTWPYAPLYPRRAPKEKIPAALRTKVYERDQYRCVTCGDFHALTLDHIKPESQGGATTLENLQTLCRSCNSRKGAR